MGTTEKIAFLADALEVQINSFNIKRRENKRKALFFRLAVTALGGLTTVLLGLRGLSNEALLQNSALIFSALVTLLSTWDTFFNHRGLWTQYTAAYTELKFVQSDLEFKLHSKGELMTDEEVDALYGRFQEILRNTNQWWQRERQKEE